MLVFKVLTKHKGAVEVNCDVTFSCWHYDGESGVTRVYSPSTKSHFTFNNHHKAKSLAAIINAASGSSSGDVSRFPYVTTLT